MCLPDWLKQLAADCTEQERQSLRINDMDIEQAMARVLREEKMWAGIVKPIKDGLAKDIAMVKRKIAAGEQLDDIELGLAINKGLIK